MLSFFQVLMMCLAVTLIVFFMVVSDGIYQRQLIEGMRQICKSKHNMTYLSHDGESIMCGDSAGNLRRERYPASWG